MPKKSKTITRSRREESAAIPTAIEPADDGRLEDGENVIALSPEEDLFITYLLNENMNRRRAYMRVYPKCKPESASVSASRMLNRDNVRAEIKRRLDEEAMSEEEGIARLSRIARGTHLPFLKQGTDGFMYFDLSDPEAQNYMYLVREVETKRERRIVGAGEAAEEWEGEWVKVKLHDAYTATVDLLKIHGKFTKKVEVTGKDGAPLNPPVDHDGFNRSLVALADALREALSGEDTKPNGTMEAPK